MHLMRSDFSTIEDPQARQHAAWRGFRAEMQNKTYGREALNAAWEFYKRGWDEGWNACDSARIAGAFR